MIQVAPAGENQLCAPAAAQVVNALDLIECAERDAPLSEALAQWLSPLSLVFAARDCLALLVAPAVAGAPPLESHASPNEIAHWSSAVLESGTVLVERAGVRVLAGRQQREAVVRRVVDCNCWSILETEGHTAVVLLQVAVDDEADLATTRESLRLLTTAFAQRRQVAENARARPQRVQTLYRMVEAIASNLDVDQVLAAIVERARELLEADCAYLSEVDEAAHRVTMRATSGIVDEGYKQSTSQLGETLFGAVAVSRQVIFTDNYVADPRFVHTPVTDANVSREGLKGTIAAPLQVGDRVLGVLGIANRGPIDTSPERLELVRGLADGAAIALENARLYAERGHLIEQLQNLNALTLSQHEALKRSVSIQNQLTELVLQGHPLDVIAHRLRQLLGNPVVVLGPFLNLLAHAGLGADDAKAITSAVAAARVIPRFAGEWTRMMATHKSIRLVRATEFEVAPAQVVTPVIVGDEVAGYVVVVETDTTLDDLEFLALQQAATVFAVELTRARVVAEVEHRLRADFVHDLVSGSFDPRLILGRATGIGHDLGVPQALLAIAPNPTAGRSEISTSPRFIDDDRRLERTVRASLQRRERMAQISVIGEVIVVLAALTGQTRTPHDEALTVARTLANDLAATLKPMTFSIGMSRVCANLDAIAGAYREALIALDQGQRFNAGGSLTTFDQLGVERVLALARDPRDLQAYVESRLGPLLAYDRERGGRLIPTLEAYLQTGGRPRETARALGIHVNSLDHRLRRIEQIGAITLDDADVRLDLALALRARRLVFPTGPNS